MMGASTGGALIPSSVVRFFFFFLRYLFFDPLTFVAERAGSEEVSPVDMVLLAGWALVPAAAFGLIPDLTGRLKVEGDGLVPHALACTGGLVLEIGALLTEEMLLVPETEEMLLVPETEEMLLVPFVEVAAAPAGMGELFVKAV